MYFLPCVPSCFSFLLVYVCYSFLAFSAVISYVFLPALPWYPERVSNALVGLLTLRLPSLRWVFLASSLRLRFSFYLGALSSVYLLVATQGLAAYSCFTTQSFWYSLKDLLAQLSASISSLVVSLYFEYAISTSPLQREHKSELRISFLPSSRKNPLAAGSRELFVSPFLVSHLMRPRFSLPSLPPFPVLSTPNSLKRGSITPSLIQRAWKGLSGIVCYPFHYIWRKALK